MAITYQVQVDTGRNNTFGATIDDISAYVISMNWRNGMSGAYDEVAPPARASIVLDNSGKEFNVEPVSAQLLTNNTFATWSGSSLTGWSVGEVGGDVSQVASHEGYGGTGTGAVNIERTLGVGLVSISQSSVMTIGRTYRATVSVTYRNEEQIGGLVLRSGSTSVSPILRTLGIYTFYFVATSATFSVANSGNVDMTIDYVELYEVPQYALIGPGMLLRIRYDTGSGYSQYFIGRISTIAPTIDPQSGQIQGQAVTLTVEDPMLELLDLEYVPEFLEGVRVDEVLTNIFETAITPWPYASSGWILGVDGASDLGITTTLHNTTFTSFDTAQTMFTFVGDAADRGNGVSAQGYIRDLMAAEAGGRFFWNGRSSAFVFHRRHRDALNTTIAATYDNTVFSAVQPVFGTDFVNDVTINYQARTVGGAASVIWTLKNPPIRLSLNKPRTVTAQYVSADNDKLRIGAKDYQEPVRGLDFTANSTEDGTGVNRSDKVGMSVVWGATSAKVTFSSISTDEVYVTAAQLRGTPIIAVDESVNAINGQSMRQYQRAPAPPMDIRLLDDRDFAEQLALYTVTKFGTPQTRFESVSFIVNGTTYETMATARLIGDIVTISESWSGHSLNYVIVGEEHAYAAGAAQTHRVRWILKPVDRERYWILGTSGRGELGSITTLAL